MESFLGSRSLGEESLQMWDLNKRLEAYLARVKFLEEENELLRTEIQHLKVSPVETSWRGKYEEEVAALRAHLDEAFREKHLAELARDSLFEEVQQVRGRCQKERAAQEEAKQLLSGSRKELEEEKRTHIWLRERATQLEKELEGMVEAHEQEKARLDQELAGFSWSLESFRVAPAPSFQPVEVEDYSKRLSSIWKGAVETYKTEVAQLEASLSQAKENLWKATEGNRQSQLQLQQLKKELASLKIRKEMLEESLSRQWQHQQGEAEKLQLAIEALEEEKQCLRAQITQVLEDRQQLMHLKMSLSLEVATYRTLLEAESTRLQVPTTDYKTASGLRDAKLEGNQSKLRAASLDRPRDLRPSPSPFLKPRLTKSQHDSTAVNLASLLPQGRSPVAHEFQKANPALQSQPMNGFDVALPDKEALAFVDVAQSSKVVLATKVEAASQSSFHESSLTFGPISPVATGTVEESFSRPEGGLQEEGDEIASPVGEEEEFHVEEPSEEPPGEATIPSVPYPTRLVSEALEIAMQEVNGEDHQLGSSLLNMPEVLNGVPSSMEEENEAAPSTSTGLKVEDTHQLQKEQIEDCQPSEQLEDVKEAVEVNGGQEAHDEQQEQGAEVWESQGAELALPPDTGSLKEERGLFTPESKEDFVGGASGSRETESYRETRPSEENEANKEQAAALQSSRQMSDLEEASECTDPAGLLGKEESWGPGTSHYHGEQPDAAGGDLEESDGGAEDLEVVSTEALHLSEDEERRELWSPSRDNEACDFQAETRTSEGLATDYLPPIGCPALSVESQQEPLFLGVEQEMLLDKTDSASVEEDGTEVVVELQAVSVEETILRDEGSVTVAGEPRIPESMGAEGPGEDVLGHQGICKDKNALDGEDIVDKEGISDKEVVSAQDSTWELDSVSQHEDVLGLETSKEEQREDPGEAPEGQLPLEQKTEEDREMGTDGDVLNEEWVVDSEATETESAEEVGDRMDRGSAESWQDQESSSQGAAVEPEFSTNAGQAEEQCIAAETEDDTTIHSQDPTPLAQSVVCEMDIATEVTSEGQGDAADEQQDESHSCPQAATETFSVSSHQSQSDDSGSEDSIESADTSPNASCKTDRIEQDLESGRRIVLEDTLPDHTPLHMYDSQVAAVAGEHQSPSESEGAAELPLLTKDSSALLEDTQQAVEEEDPCSPQTEVSGKEQAVVAVDVSGGAGEEGGCYEASALKQALPNAEEPPIQRDFKEETAELSRDDEDIPVIEPVIEPETPREEETPVWLEAECNQQPGELLEQGNDTQQESEVGEQPLEEAGGGTDEAGESEKDSVFQAGELDLSNIQEGTWVERDAPECYDASNQEAEEAPKVSPLTSVADLGEIVLDGELPPEVQKGDAESQEVAFYEEEGLLPVCESQQILDLESGGGEDATQLRDLAEKEPSGVAGPDPSPEVAVSISKDGMKDSDILEIVEQALEFNQELIKAAGQGMETEQPAPEGSARHFREEEGPSTSIASSSVEESQSFTDPPQASSARAKDPPASTESWTESHTNGLQPDPHSADFAAEILNGIGGFHPDNVAIGDDNSREEPLKKVAIAQQFLEEEVADLPKLGTLAPSPPAREEALRPEEWNSEKMSVSRSGLEAPDADERMCADVLQTAGLKGNDAELEAISISPHYGDDILCRESDQHLKIRPEDGQELWFSESN